MADHSIAHIGSQATYTDQKNDLEIVGAVHAEHEEEDGLPKDHMDFNRVDKEVAKYASDVAIDISPEENSRLKRKIDKRVLSIMIFTYFLQALDKGTMSFASIMVSHYEYIHIPLDYQIRKFSLE
jgi:hypothetical protein